MTGQQRTRAGVPAGGQFATAGHDESDVMLGDDESRAARNFRKRRAAKRRVTALIDVYDTSQPTDQQKLLDDLVEAVKAVRHQERIDEISETTPTRYDYISAANDAIVHSGLTYLSDSEEVYVDNPANNLGFKVYGSMANIETDNLDDDLGKIIEIERSPTGSGPPSPRWVNVTPAASPGQSLPAEGSQFVSVALTNREERAVRAWLTNKYGHEDYREIYGHDYDWGSPVRRWSEGTPLLTFDTADVSPDARDEWDTVTAAVKEVAPSAHRDYEIIEGLRKQTVADYMRRCEHIGSDQWVEERIAFTIGNGN